MLATPGGFRHLHLNSVDPDAAIDFYRRQFPPTTRTRWGDLPLLASPNDVLVLFTKVAAAPATSPRAHRTDKRCSLGSLTVRPGWATCGLPCGSPA